MFAPESPPSPRLGVWSATPARPCHGLSATAYGVELSRPVAVVSSPCTDYVHDDLYLYGRSRPACRTVGRDNLKKANFLIPLDIRNRFVSTPKPLLFCNVGVHD